MDENHITSSSLVEKLKKAREESQLAQKAAEKVESYSKQRLRSEEETRHSLTFLFIAGFFSLICAGSIFVAAYNALAVGWIIKLNAAGLVNESQKISLLELDKVLSLIVSALGTSLGFIIGYYFKNKDR